MTWNNICSNCKGYLGLVGPLLLCTICKPNCRRTKFYQILAYCGAELINLNKLVLILALSYHKLRPEVFPITPLLLERCLLFVSGKQPCMTWPGKAWLNNEI